jgi:FtsP/CotA-like multicopper oxidase with cupredoxin domain
VGRIAPVAKRIGDATVRMLAYDGSIPGPTLRVEQGSALTVNVRNDGDLDATVHWHGLRVDNRFDGTTETQQPIPIGGTFAYRLEFPDAGCTRSTRRRARSGGSDRRATRSCAPTSGMDSSRSPG